MNPPVCSKTRPFIWVYVMRAPKCAMPRALPSYKACPKIYGALPCELNLEFWAPLSKRCEKQKPPLEKALPAAPRNAKSTRFLSAIILPLKPIRKSFAEMRSRQQQTAEPADLRQWEAWTKLKNSSKPLRKPMQRAIQKALGSRLRSSLNFWRI